MRTCHANNLITTNPNPWLALFADSQPGDRLTELLSHNPVGLPALLGNADSISAGPKPFHSGSVLKHMARCMNECAGDLLAVWLAMAHDAGKLNTPQALLPHHYGHEIRGKKLARIWAGQMKLSEQWADYGSYGAEQHMRAAKFFKMRPGKKLSLLKEINKKGIAKSFWRLIDADTRHPYSQIMLNLGAKVGEWEGVPEHKQILMLADLCRQ